jgi:hypothetical protein
VFYAKRRNDTIFFAGLATKKTSRTNAALKTGNGQKTKASLWCTSNSYRPKHVHIIPALLHQAYDYKHISDDLFYR